MSELQIPSHYQNRYRQVFVSVVNKSRAGIEYIKHIKTYKKIVLEETRENPLQKDTFAGYKTESTPDNKPLHSERHPRTSWWKTLLYYLLYPFNRPRFTESNLENHCPAGNPKCIANK